MSGILLAGIARNVRRPLRDVLLNVDRYGKLFDEHKILVVEDRSTDGTKEFLRTWAGQVTNRVHIEADELSVVRNPKNPRGRETPLLARIRNLYMARVDEEDIRQYPFVGIFDCDNVNVRPINYGSILAATRFLTKCASRAAVFANQRGFTMIYGLSVMMFGALEIACKSSGCGMKWD